MKIQIILVTLVSAITLALAGCGKDEAGTPAAGVNTVGLEKSFMAAETALKDASAKAVILVKQGDYAGAIKELQSLAANVKVTDEQKKAINDLIDQVNKALAAAGSKALGDAQKALGK